MITIPSVVSGRMARPRFAPGTVISALIRKSYQHSSVRRDDPDAFGVGRRATKQLGPAKGADRDVSHAFLCELLFKSAPWGMGKDRRASCYSATRLFTVVPGSLPANTSVSRPARTTNVRRNQGTDVPPLAWAPGEPGTSVPGFERRPCASDVRDKTGTLHLLYV